ncbi:MAG: hypothetical protein HKN68_11935 [Saprospiraceae bacterium]|nr:hypothetical protein [Saprospiraceae bacterium]
MISIFRILIICIFLAFICCSTPSADPSIIESYFKTHNNHLVKDALEYYHEEITFTLIGVWTKKGKKEIATLETWDSTLHSSLKLKDYKINGDTIFCTVVEKNDWFNRIGIDSLIHDPTIFIIKDNLIHEIIATPEESIGIKMNETMEIIFGWCMENKDTTINELIIGGQFVYSAVAAESWMDLFDKMKQ